MREKVVGNVVCPVRTSRSWCGLNSCDCQKKKEIRECQLVKFFFFDRQFLCAVHVFTFFLLVLFELLDIDYCFSVSALRLPQKPYLYPNCNVEITRGNVVRLIAKGNIFLLSLHLKNNLN